MVNAAVEVNAAWPVVAAGGAPSFSKQPKKKGWRTGGALNEIHSKKNVNGPNFCFFLLMGPSSAPLTEAFEGNHSFSVGGSRAHNNFVLHPRCPFVPGRCPVRDTPDWASARKRTAPQFAFARGGAFCVTEPTCEVFNDMGLPEKTGRLGRGETSHRGGIASIGAARGWERQAGREGRRALWHRTATGLRAVRTASLMDR